MQYARLERLRDQAIPEETDRPQTEDELGFQRRTAVRWFSPAVLAKAALRVTLSLAIGDFLDKRELQQALDANVLSHAVEGREVWIDFIADTGDGFDATYSVAWLASQKSLQPLGAPEPLPRGGLLVLGGDEVYPVGSPEEYENRFRGPFLASLPHTVQDHPEVIAIPGNHDWYDGLTNFMRVFGQRKWLGGRRTIQSRSYFAVRLPRNWWLWGIDIQFDSYIDEPQLRYFEHVADQMGEGARVILCTARPAWVDVEADPEAFRNLAYLESRLLQPAKARLMVSISGDSHHYARYSADDGTQKITAGGGGAFLHPTHHLDDQLNVPVEANPRLRQTKPYRLQHRYPDLASSRSLSFGALALPVTNWKFAFLPALLYVLLGWSSQFANRVLERRFDDTLDTASRMFGLVDLLVGLLRNPVSVLLLILIALGLVGFAKPSPQWSRGTKKWVAKLLLGGTHFVVQIGVGVSVGLLVLKMASPAHGTTFNVVVLVLTALAGGLAGTLTMGAYLAVSCRFLRAHGNEAFSSMSLGWYKHFLRMHLDGDGVLTIFPIGLDRANKRWKLDANATDKEASWLAPDGISLEPRLIESPIVVDPRPRDPEPVPAPPTTKRGTARRSGGPRPS